jgi:hypothetical protein
MPPVAVPCVDAKEASTNVDRSCLFENEILM